MRMEKRLTRLIDSLKVVERNQSTIALLAHATNQLDKLNTDKKKKGIKK